MSLSRTLSFTICLAAATSAPAQEQSDFYTREEIPLPQGETMELGSIALMPDQKIAVTSRRGDLWICTGAYGDDLSKVTWKKFAEGLHEPLGMFWKDGWLYLTQRPEVTRIKDSDNDGVADTFEGVGPLAAPVASVKRRLRPGGVVRMASWQLSQLHVIPAASSHTATRPTGRSSTRLPSSWNEYTFSEASRPSIIFFT